MSAFSSMSCCRNSLISPILSIARSISALVPRAYAPTLMRSSASAYTAMSLLTAAAALRVRASVTLIARREIERRTSTAG